MKKVVETDARLTEADVLAHCEGSWGVLNCPKVPFLWM
jgi:hypothetical protein